MTFDLTAKQKEYWKNATHRWNVKSGATRSGKTWLDYYIIPKRILALKGLQGHVVLLGNTQSTLERNVLEPMREMYGDKLVGYVNNQNKVKLFGRICYALGADKVSQVKKIQGSSIAYCYGDEVVTWSEEVFQMLKSRLDKEYSCFDGTCNPENPRHWFKKFLESDADIYLQEYTIDDNEYLPKSFVEALKKEYAGTVYYFRYILGKWCNAEGLLFPQYANNPKKWEVEELPSFCMVNLGVDIGGTKSHSPIVATGIEIGYTSVCSFKYDRVKHSKGTVNVDMICQRIVRMLEYLEKSGYVVTYIFVDNAEQVIINSIMSYVMSKGFSTVVTDCKKVKGKTRILTYNLMLNTNKMFFKDVPEITESLSTALYDEKQKEDAILDDFTTDIDTFDAHFYSWSYFIDYIGLEGGL